MKIRHSTLDDPRIVALVRLHLSGMHEASPPGSVYALDDSGLRSPDVSVFTAWEGEELLGMGALREIDRGWGEIKSMRTDPAHLRRGVGRAILEHLLGVARERGYSRVSLETGSGPAFEAAIAMYRARGFVPGEPFGGYVPSEFNQFMHLDVRGIEQGS
ncbi:MAG: GNAT family N-acetyltransferase [Phycisphaerales bacterium]